MATFAEHQPGLHPTFIRGRWGVAWGAVAGAAKDTLLEGAKNAVRAGFVLLAPDDALPYLLADASLEGLPGETIDAQRVRVRQAFDTWELAGTYPGLTLAFDQLGLTGYTVHTWREYGTYPPDSHTERWASWLATITGHSYAADGLWSDPGTWDDGGTWDSTATVDDIARMRRLVRAQMMARDRGWMRFRFDAGADFWGPDAPWDHGTWTDDTSPVFFTLEV